ncbi:MAG: aminoglycoside phosphotransferase family protein [bacterium]
MSKALNLAESIKNGNTADILTKFKMKKFLIDEARILKKKLIVSDSYKITAEVILKNKRHFILEIHDNNYYFKKNIYSLKNLKVIKLNGKKAVAAVFAFNEDRKIILREYLKGECLLEILKKDDTEENFSLVKNSAIWIAGMHNLLTKNMPVAVKRDVNFKIEKSILTNIKKLIKPQIKNYRADIMKNLNYYINNYENFKKKVKNCLIHGDFQPANIMADGEIINIMDFDTLCVGNPARDIGRFIMQLKFVCKNHIEYQKTFIDAYFKISKYKNDQEFNKATAFYQVEMLFYIILGQLWGNNIPNKDVIKNILNEQNNLFKLFL